MSRKSDELEAPAELEQDVAACRRLASGGADAPRSAASGPELERLRARVQTAVADDRGLLGTLRSLRRTQRVALITLLVALLMVAVAWITPRPDLARYPVGHMAFVLGLLAILTVGAGWRLFRPLHLAAPRPLVPHSLVAVVVALTFTLAAWPLDHAGAAAGDGRTFVVGCLKCLAFGGALGLPVGLLAHAARRSRAGGAVVAALAGVVAGLVGNLCLQVHCPITDPGHLLWGHAPLLVALGATAALVGRSARSAA